MSITFRLSPILMSGTSERDAMSKRPFYLPSGFKKRKNKVVTGVSKTGEVAPSGLVSHIEDWEGRVAVVAAPSTINYIWNKHTGEFRAKTMDELIKEGKFIRGKGPTGVTTQRSKIG